ncbi:SpoIIE family protein phosphatase [Kitasatospora sp. NBC_00240]|uniref:SpoIIE family protein phosphatase n=1 Tax=Kitasatospora sp. NBC_00240 TaxID=2903567 RepID=UPI00224D1E5D|nr:SpoIIE family protein phosphatase [Kitasatospora sp. NBC_00240]MCX5209894.1 SpoIIE family protein phosphatase [Kitasatospora sp. NBC_00240]
MRDSDRDEGEAALLAALFGGAPRCWYVLDRELRLVQLNRAARTLRCLPGEEAVGRRLTDFVPGFPAAEMTGLAAEVLATGATLTGRLVRGHPAAAPDRAQVLSLTLYRLEDGVSGEQGEPLGVAVAVEDVTARESAAERLAVLHRAHRTIGSTLDIATTAQELADVTVPRFADATTVDVLDEAWRAGPAHEGPVSPDHPLRRAAYRTRHGGELPVRIGRLNTFPFPTPFTQSLADIRPRLVSRLDYGERWLETDPVTTERWRTAGVHSLIAVPLVVHDTVLGLAAYYRYERPDPFDEDDLELARELTARAALSLDKARSYARERTVATALQRYLLPQQPPSVSAVDAAHLYMAGGAGSDWYDVIQLSGARVALVVGDLAGRGVEAAATMGQLRTAVRTLAALDLPPDELLERLDTTTVRLARDSAVTPGSGDPGSEMIASCLVLTYDPVSRRCTAARAGHPQPLVLDPSGKVLPFEVPGGPHLGVGGAGFESASVELPAGSVLALYTNGLVTDRGRDSDASLERLHQVLARPGRSLQELCDAAVYTLVPERPGDDAVLLLARTHHLAEGNVAAWTFPDDLAVVSHARELAERQLVAWGLDDLVYSTQLIVSELVTNAIRYGKGAVQLRLIRDRTLICEVSDRTNTAPHLRQAGSTDEGGRGLFIVMQLSAQWGTRYLREGKTIWAEQPLPGPL